MFSGWKSAEKRREDIEVASKAVEAALAALREDDPKRARAELAAAPKTHFADTGWKVALATALIELAQGRRKQGLQHLIAVCRRLDETSLSRHDQNYLLLYALYRGSEASKTGKAPPELRELVEDFRFDHTLVSAQVREQFPLKKVEESLSPPPPPPPPPDMGEAGF